MPPASWVQTDGRTAEVVMSKSRVYRNPHGGEEVARRLIGTSRLDYFGKGGDGNDSASKSFVLTMKLHGMRQWS